MSNLNARGQASERMSKLLQKHRYSMNAHGCACGGPSTDYYEHLSKVVVDEMWVEDE